jgi:hypothetical protein
MGVSIMYLCVWGLDHVLVCVRFRSCTCVHVVSIMYLCVWGLDLVLVCIGSPTHKYMIETPYTQVHDRDTIHTSTWSRPPTHKYMIETPYTQVHDRDPMHTSTVCMGSRSCTCVCGLSIMYLCACGVDHVPVCMGSRSCTCVYWVSIVPFSTIFIFYFGIVPTLWYFLLKIYKSTGYYPTPKNFENKFTTTK